MKPGSPNSMHRREIPRASPVSVGPTSQPARRPGSECDLDRLLMVTTCSGMAGRKTGNAPAGRETRIHFVCDDPQRNAGRQPTMSPKPCPFNITAAGLFRRREKTVRGSVRDRRLELCSGRGETRPRPVPATRNQSRARRSDGSGILGYKGSSAEHLIPRPRHAQRRRESEFCAPERKITLVPHQPPGPVRRVCACASRTQTQAAGRRRVADIAGAQGFDRPDRAPASASPDPDRRYSARSHPRRAVALRELW